MNDQFMNVRTYEMRLMNDKTNYGEEAGNT